MCDLASHFDDTSSAKTTRSNGHLGDLLSNQIQLIC